MIKPNKAFWLIAFAAMIGLTLPTLIQDGMFMDAMLYTSVSHNLSMGIGTFWFPEFSVHNVGGLSSFHEQPPLVFGIQSLFYTVLGDSMYVERFYTFLTMVITAFLINLVWKEIYKNDTNLSGLGWLPVILWITIPVSFWSYSNNMHENTMGIFTLTSVWLMYKAMLSPKFKILTWGLAGVFIFLATLSKGIPGFFPVTVPFLFWLTTRKNNFRGVLLQTLILVAVPAIIYAVLFSLPDSRESLSTYLFKRALHRINEVPTVDSRFWIIYRLFTELLLQIIFVAIFITIARFKKIKTYISGDIRQPVFFLSVGLSASAPLMLTLVQKGFYFVPALPFFAIGLAMLVAPALFSMTSRIDVQSKKYRILLLASSFLFLGATTFALMQKGKTSRDKDLLHDVYLIGATLAKGTSISIPVEMWDDFSLQCYLSRYFSISLEAKIMRGYYIQDNTTHTHTPADYEKTDLKTTRYDLYKRKKQFLIDNANRR
jgi:4-amino-4-deoxy-L-arabinose transferase-like glycosyltransferase